MLKWLGKVMWWRRRSKDLVVHDYGRYVHKPVIQRALAYVMGISPTAVIELIMDTEVSLNDAPLEIMHLGSRMESGNYEVKIPSQSRVWRFFIV